MARSTSATSAAAGCIRALNPSGMIDPSGNRASSSRRSRSSWARRPSSPSSCTASDALCETAPCHQTGEHTAQPPDRLPQLSRVPSREVVVLEQRSQDAQ